jgi:hypothetical protein
MLHRLPRQLPPVPRLLDDLGHPPPAAIARALGVSARTVRRWGDEWPRPAHLAIFFASRWGWSAVESDALTAWQLAQAQVQALAEELSAERARDLSPWRADR